VALASATAAAARRYVIGLGPIFPVATHPILIGPGGLAGCVLAGVLAGALSAALTLAVYACEDAFQRLPVHWMWWPALGGLAIGLGGLVFPEALGVGYNTIGQLLRGDATTRIILGVLLVKGTIWAISLGSGTSGGVLAPLLMMGGALGALEAHWLPFEGPGFWPLVSMGAILGGAMRLPLTGIVFCVELTHDMNVMLPLLVGATTAHAFTVLTLRRSILTEKVARRGFHLSREYSVDPLEILFVREVMRTSVVALPGEASVQEMAASLGEGRGRGQRLYPVVGDGDRLVGAATRRELKALIVQGSSERLSRQVRVDPVVAFADEPLRAVAYRMASRGVTRLPVVERGNGRRLVGMVSLEDLLKARALNLEAEQRRDRIHPLHLLFPRWAPRPDETGARAPSAP
jgi:CBS domain-containing protein